MVSWKNDFYFIGKDVNEERGNPAPSPDSLKFVVSFPQTYANALHFRLDQTPRWFRVRPWKSLISTDGPISQTGLRNEGNVHAAVALNIDKRTSYKLEVVGKGSHRYLSAVVSAPNLGLLEENSLKSKATSKPQKTLESLTKYLTLISGLRNGNIFLRGAAAYNRETEEVILFPGANGRQKGKTLALAHCLSRGYEPLANSHIWLKFADERLYVYPQRLGDPLPMRIRKSHYEGELTDHNLDTESIEAERKSIGAKPLGAKIGKAQSPEDVLVYVNTPKDRVGLKIPLDKLLVLWPEDLNLASGELYLVPRQPEDILQNLHRSWYWNIEQIIKFGRQFIDKNRAEARFNGVLEDFVEGLTLNDYMQPVVQSTDEALEKASDFFKDVLRPEHYREAHGSPTTLLSQFHEVAYKMAPVSLEDRLGLPITRLMRTLNENLRKCEELKIAGTVVDYYNAKDMHRLFHDGVRPPRCRSETDSFTPQSASELADGHVIDSIFRDLAFQRGARRILNVRCLDPDGNIVGSYKFASPDGVYSNTIEMEP